jgi:hypothetical protein
VIEGEVNPEEVFALMEKYPKAFFALSFKGDGFVLKIKPKAPADGKKSKKEGGPVADFCSLKTEDRGIVNELFFGVGDFQVVSVNHTIEVTDIVYPSNVAELKPSEVRELAKRKGVLKRKVIADMIEKNSEAEFTA